jgi:hypothetical protein
MALPTTVTSSPWIALLRHALTAVGSMLVTQGVMDDGMMQELIGAFITFASVGWYWFTRPTA